MLKLNVQDMSCGHCAASVTKAVKAVDPSADVRVDLGSKLVTVETTVAPDAIRSAIGEAGYASELAA
ncbi:heavy-metal-associated domain-containing protein [Aureimonas ureilytica]|uniref:heavy-metal-associated domain-containing protein n=1 Tax=Aureimonas ureilytica TaxID=401562 RepID=UPI00036C2588|nr:heavy-metal-associated domain-containing protein [Aureimonas ureilytica]